MITMTMLAMMFMTTDDDDEDDDNDENDSVDDSDFRQLDFQAAGEEGDTGTYISNGEWELIGDFNNDHDHDHDDNDGDRKNDCESSWWI